jgi:hypothetical protein
MDRRRLEQAGDVISHTEEQLEAIPDPASNLEARTQRSRPACTARESGIGLTHIILPDDASGNAQPKRGGASKE